MMNINVDRIRVCDQEQALRLSTYVQDLMKKMDLTGSVPLACHRFTQEVGRHRV